MCRYFDIIKNPMDISTMSAKLAAGQYPDRYAFRDDFKLIISNAITFNIAGVVVELAQKLDAFFNKKWDSVEATLRSIETGVPVAKLPKAPKAPKVAASAAPEPYIPPAYVPPPVPDQPPPPRASAQLFQQREPPPPPPPPPAAAVEPAPTPIYAPAPVDVPPPRASAELFQQREPPPPPPPPPAALEVAPVVYEPRPPPPPPPPPYVPPGSAEQSPAPPTPSFGLSFKLKAPAPPAAPAPTPPPPPPPMQAPPVAEPVKPQGFKIKLGGDYGAAAPPPPLPVVKAPKSHKSKVTRDYSDDDDDDDWGGKAASSRSSRDREDSVPHKHKHKKKDKDRERKHKHKKEVNYAEPEVPYLPPAELLPPRPEILDESPLPHPSKWVKSYETVDTKKAKGVIGKLQTMREAYFFLQPVDPIALPMCVWPSCGRRSSR